MQQVMPAHEAEASVDEPVGEGVIAGRPAEDWSFELVEVVAGGSFGLAVGTAVAGPVGTVVGCVVGAAAGLLTGEAWESAAGRAAKTTNAAESGPDDQA